MTKIEQNNDDYNLSSVKVSYEKDGKTLTKTFKGKDIMNIEKGSTQDGSSNPADPANKDNTVNGSANFEKLIDTEILNSFESTTKKDAVLEAKEVFEGFCK